MYTSIDELQQAVTGAPRLDGNTLYVTDEHTLRETIIDPLVFTAVFAADPALKTQARSVIRHLAAGLGIRSSSLRQYYLAIGRGEVPVTSTVPAINLRTLTYDMARVLFKLKREQHIGPLIVELARSEMGYTNQQYDEFAVAVLAAAIKEGYRGPVFLQADHVQVNAPRYQEDPASELQTMKHLIKEAMEAGFHQIDIDASTLVSLSKTTLVEQQAENSIVTAALTDYIRSLETQGTISIGGEIGHIGGKNSTPEELEAFLAGYENALGKHIPGLSKISVQTGTSHGGVPLPDGRIAEVNLDFSVLERTGQLARDTYHLGGVVQHGASTLPIDVFDQFPRHKTLEIHLATGFQSIIFGQMPERFESTSTCGWNITVRTNGKQDGLKNSSSTQLVRKPLALLNRNSGSCLNRKSVRYWKRLNSSSACSLSNSTSSIRWKRLKDMSKDWITGNSRESAQDVRGRGTRLVPHP